MRYSINDYSISPKAKGCGNGWPLTALGQARVTADRSIPGSMSQAHRAAVDICG